MPFAQVFIQPCHHFVNSGLHIQKIWMTCYKVTRNFMLKRINKADFYFIRLLKEWKWSKLQQQNLLI